MLSLIGGALGLARRCGHPRHLAPSADPREHCCRPSSRWAWTRASPPSVPPTALVVGVLFGLVPAWQATEFASPSHVIAAGQPYGDRGAAAEHGAPLLVAGQAGPLPCSCSSVRGCCCAPSWRSRAWIAAIAPRGADDVRGPAGLGVSDDEAELQFYEVVAGEVGACLGFGVWPGRPRCRWGAGTRAQGCSRSWATRRRRRASTDGGLPGGRAATYFRPSIFRSSPAELRRRDTPDGVQVCIVNEAFVRAHLRGRSPLGMSVSCGGPRGPAGRGARSSASPAR